MMVDCCELRTSVHCPFLAVFWFVFRFGVWVVLLFVSFPGLFCMITLE